MANEEDENNEDAAASEWINGINGLPAYAFRPQNPSSKHESGAAAAVANYVYRTFRTRRLFKYFYWLIQLVLVVALAWLSGRVYARLIIYNGKRLNWRQILTMARGGKEGA